MATCPLEKTDFGGGQLKLSFLRIPWNYIHQLGFVFVGAISMIDLFHDYLFIFETEMEIDWRMAGMYSTRGGTH